YIEQANLYQLVDLNAAANVQNAVTSQRIALYLCPSELNDKAKPGTTPTAISRYPLNYAANVGSWLVWNPVNGQGGDGAIVRRRDQQGATRVGDSTDGLSTTGGFAEVKAYGAYLLGGTPTTTPPPTPAAMIALGGTVRTESAHTGWTEGQTFHNGVTFVFTP